MGFLQERIREAKENGVGEKPSFVASSFTNKFRSELLSKLLVLPPQELVCWLQLQDVDDVSELALSLAKELYLHGKTEALDTLCKHPLFAGLIHKCQETGTLMAIFRAKIAGTNPTTPSHPSAHRQ